MIPVIICSIIFFKMQNYIKIIRYTNKNLIEDGRFTICDFVEMKIINTFAVEKAGNTHFLHGKVLYDQLPRNPPGLDRSKGTLVVAVRCSQLSRLPL